MTNPYQCPSCGTNNRIGARFCSQCGISLTASEAGSMPSSAPGLNPSARVSNKRWQRRPGEIAARIDSASLPGFFQKELIVEEGTAALILLDGQATLLSGPGRYAMQTFFDRIQNLGRGYEVTALLMDSGEIHLEFALQGLSTRDPLRLSATVRLVMQLQDPAKFALNILKGNATYTESDLRALLFPEVFEAAKVFVGNQTARQLEDELAERGEFFGVDIRQRLNDSFQEAGLTFKRVQILDLFHPRYDELRKQEEQLFLGPQELLNQQRLYDLQTEGSRFETAKAETDALGKLDARKRLFAVYNQDQLQALAEEDQKVTYHERRAQIWQRVRRIAQEDRIHKVQTDQEWQTFVVQVDRERLLREDELQKLRDALRWETEDRRQARAHLMALAQVQTDFELRSARLNEQFRHDQARLLNELELAELDTIGRLELEQKRVAMQLDLQDRQAQFRRVQKEADDLAARQALMEETLVQRRVAFEQTQGLLERKRVEIEIERMEDDNDLLTAAKAQAMMRENRAQKLLIEFEDTQRRQMAALEAEEIRHRLELERKAQEQAHELSRIREMSQATDEALIMLGDKENAQMLVQLKRDKLLAGMSPEQMETMIAEGQPAMIEAIKARYAAAAADKASAVEAEKWKALLDQAQAHQGEMLRRSEEERTRQTQQSKDEADRQERMNREAADRQERIAGKALDSATDIAKAFAQRPDKSDGPTVVFGPGGGMAGGGVSVGGAVGGFAGAGGRVLVCPDCLLESPVGTKHCSNCGHAFFK